MTRAETQHVLAVLMRQGEWMLDDAAHSVGGGRLSQQRCHDTAVALEDLAAFLRECCAELPEQSGAEAHRAAPRHADIPLEALTGLDLGARHADNDRG